MELSTLVYSVWGLGAFMIVFMFLGIWILTGLPKAIAKRMKEEETRTTIIKTALEKAVGPVPPVVESVYSADVNSRQDEDRNLGGEEYLHEEPRILVAPVAVAPPVSNLKRPQGRPPKQQAHSPEVIALALKQYYASQTNKKKSKRKDEDDSEDTQDDSEDL